MNESPIGQLLLVPNALDFGLAAEVDLRELLPDAVIATAARLRHWVVEDAKSARAFLKRVDAITPLGVAIQAIAITELPRPAKGGAARGPSTDLRHLLDAALTGNDIGLMSEAGMPAIADPGAALVEAAHLRGIAVRSLVGPSSLLLALAASGLNGQSFAFVGYLPVDAVQRAARLRELEALSRRSGQTQIVIETPYRNSALLAAMVEVLAPGTRLSVSCGLSLPAGVTRSASVERWRANRWTVADKVPAVFCWLAR
jgi:16S rRNA (cytidine1402-2'-O)-methyltransferase